MCRTKPGESYALQTPSCQPTLRLGCPSAHYSPCFADAREVKDIAIKVRRELNREGPESFFRFRVGGDSQERVLSNHTKNLTIEYPVSGDRNEGFFDFSKKIRSVRIEDCEGDVNKVLEMLAERTSEFEGDTEDGTCLFVNPSVLVDWQIRP